MIKKLIFFLMCILVITACGNNKKSNALIKGFNGYVVSKHDDEILVVSSSAEENNKYPNLRLYDVSSNIEVGQKVEVWAGDKGISSNKDIKLRAIDVIKVNSYRPKGAVLTQEEAISKALSTRRDQEYIAIKGVVYNNQKSEWVVTVVSTNMSIFVVNDSKETSITVTDRKDNIF